MGSTADGQEFRDCMIEIVDDCRTMIDEELCLRLYEAATVRRRWSGPQLGQGTFRDTTTVIAPRPRVREPAPHLKRDNPGTYEKGDRIVDKLSATLTIADLTGGKLEKCEEFFWLINDERYAVVTEPDELYVDWKVHLRRSNRPRKS